MKFRISSAVWYEIDSIIENYPCLLNFGFEIEKTEKPKICKIRDENGKHIEFEYGSKTEYTPYIHLEKIEDVISLSKAVKHDLIVSSEQNSIMIYDGYIE